MIIIVSENPDPASPLRRGVDIEFRMMVKGATHEEGERIGEAIRDIMNNLRPGQKLKAFSMDAEEATLEN